MKKKEEETERRRERRERLEKETYLLDAEAIAPRLGSSSLQMFAHLVYVFLSFQKRNPLDVEKNKRKLRKKSTGQKKSKVSHIKINTRSEPDEFHQDFC